MRPPITRCGKQLLYRGRHAADCASEEIAQMLAMLANGQATIEPGRSVEQGALILAVIAGAFVMGGVVL